MSKVSQDVGKKRRFLKEYIHNNHLHCNCYPYIIQRAKWNRWKDIINIIRASLGFTKEEYSKLE